MLIFKNNIYDRTPTGLPGFSKSPAPDYDEWFDPPHFIQSALLEEKEVLAVIERQPKEFWKEDSEKFYPYSAKTGGLHILRGILGILLRGLDDRNIWYHMNTYHFCFLYDVLIRYVFNFNHDSGEEKLKALPELRGKSINFPLFIKNYFFNTVFLMDENEYNSLTHQEKIDMGYKCPCQFGVINGLLPTHEEMELKEAKDYPYSIYV